MLKHYEIVFVVHPNVPEGELSKVTDKVTSIITQHKGEVIKFKEWGRKKFAYKIRKCTKGYYFLLYFMATPALLAELQRSLRIDEKILRYQTIRLGKGQIEALLTEKEDQDRKGEEYLPSEHEATPAEAIKESMGQE